MPIREMTPAMLHIGFVLATGATHGYAIMQEVETLTAGEMRLGPGTLYRSLQRMEVEGWIEEVLDTEAESQSERRRSYRLTRRGREAMEKEARRLRALVRLAEQRGLVPGD